MSDPRQESDDRPGSAPRPANGPGGEPPGEHVGRLFAHMESTYHSLRYLLAVVALTFLVLLLLYRYLGNDTVYRLSISAYYHNQGRLFELLPVRDLFVGSFTSVALMLWAYKGFKRGESLLLNAAAFGLLVVVTCPMEWAQPAVVADDISHSLHRSSQRAEFVAGADIPGDAKPLADELSAAVHKSRDDAKALARKLSQSDAAAASQDHWPHTVRGWLHYAGAILFFLCLAAAIWLHAEDTLQFIPEEDRGPYRLFYRGAGVAMGCVPVAAVAMYFLGHTVVALRSWVFWVELAGVLIFVAYWAVKTRELRWGAELIERGRDVGINKAVESIRRGEYGADSPKANP